LIIVASLLITFTIVFLCIQKKRSQTANTFQVIDYTESCYLTFLAY